MIKPVAGEGGSRHEPGFETQNVVGRFDIYPTISLPTFFRGWTFRPEVGVRETMRRFTELHEAGQLDTSDIDSEISATY